MPDIEKIRAAAARARYTIDPSDEELLEAEPSVAKSLQNRLRDKLQKAKRQNRPVEHR